MSLFRPMTLNCPHCGYQNCVEIAGSINADRRPDYRDAIMENRFQDATCERCNQSFRTEPAFNYLDVGRGQWIAALPAQRMPDYLEEEDSVLESFHMSYGNASTPAAQAIGKELSVRVTFGWPALREKLLIRQLELDDVAVEEVKLDMLRRLPDAPLAPGIEMRLVGLEDDRMTFVWIDSLTEEVQEQVTLNRKLYDLVAEDRGNWSDVTLSLTDGPFVDMQKLYMGHGRVVQSAS